MTFEDFKNRLEKSTQEDEVRGIYATYFKLKYNTSNRHDLYTPQILFEFKADKNFHNLKALATILAQSLYYIRRLKYIDVEKAIPFFICLADKNEATITETRKWSTYYTNDSYDWERPASKPDPKLIDHLVKEPETSKIHVYSVTKKQEQEAFKKNLDNALHPQMIMDFGDKKVINEENFEAVYKTNGMRIVLIALHEDAVMQKHTAEGLISVQVLEGEILFNTDDQSVVIRKGQLIALHKGLPHSVKATKESVFLLTLTTTLDK